MSNIFTNVEDHLEKIRKESIQPSNHVPIHDSGYLQALFLEVT